MAIFHFLVVLSIWLALAGAAAGNYYLMSGGATLFIILAGVAAYVDDTGLDAVKTENQP